MGQSGYYFDQDYREQATLGDGTVVTLAVVGPEDRDLVRRGFVSLSPATRYLRFMSRKGELSEQELEALTSLDGVNHFAIGALRRDPDSGEAEGLGIARFARLPDEPKVAEPAVTVVDTAQGRGLGTLLLQRLAAAAYERGVQHFRCEILACNTPMRKLIQDHAASTVVEQEGDVIRALVELPSAWSRLPPPAADRRNLLYRLLASTARGTITMRLGDLLLKRH